MAHVSSEMTVKDAKYFVSFVPLTRGMAGALALTSMQAWERATLYIKPLPERGLVAMTIVMPAAEFTAADAKLLHDETLLFVDDLKATRRIEADSDYVAWKDAVGRYTASA